VRHRIEAENQFWRLDIDAVDIEIIGAVDLGSVQFRASDKQMDQLFRERESGLCNVLEQVSHEILII
jgi:hypothetical protein